MAALVVAGGRVHVRLQGAQVEPSRLVMIIRRWWPVLVVATLLGGLVANRLASGSDPRYSARTELLVGPINAASDTLRAAGQLAQTYAQLAQSRATLVAATEGLGIRDLDEVTVTASGSDVTRLLTIDVRYDDPELATTVADALALELATLADEDTTEEAGRLRVIEPATAGEAVAPEVEAITVLGAIAALVAAVGLLLLLEQLSTRIRTAGELTEATRLPVLASLGAERPPLSPGSPATSLVVEGLPRSATATSFRVAATSLETVRADGARLRTLVVLGATPASGSGDIAANLAAAFSEMGRRSLLLHVGEPDATIDALAGRASVGPDPIDIGLPTKRGMAVLDAAAANDDHLDAGAAAEFLRDLLTKADVVVVHADPAPTSVPTLVWAGLADGVVVLARRHAARAADVAANIAAVERVRAHLVGVLFDERPSGRSSPRALVQRDGAGSRR